MIGFKGKGQRAKGKEQGAESKEQRAKGRKLEIGGCFFNPKSRPKFMVDVSTVGICIELRTSEPCRRSR